MLVSDGLEIVVGRLLLDEIIAVWTIVGTVLSLKTGKVTGGASRFLMQPVTISVELGLDEIFVPLKGVGFEPFGMKLEKVFGVFPGLYFNFETF